LRPPRISFKGGVYHVTVRCNNREFHFKDESDFYLYLLYLEKARIKYEVEIHAYCLTHNHVHLVLGTSKNENLSIFMQYLNGEFAKAYNRKYKRSGHFWGSRFHSTVIESETQLLNTTIYVERNMVVNGHVSSPEDWLFSSFNQHTRGIGPIDINFHETYLELGKNKAERQKNYRVLMQESLMKNSFVEHLPELIVCGSEEFVESTIREHYHPYYKDRKIYQVAQNIFSLKKINNSS